MSLGAISQFRKTDAIDVIRFFVFSFLSPLLAAGTLELRHKGQTTFISCWLAPAASIKSSPAPSHIGRASC